MFSGMKQSFFVVIFSVPSLLLWACCHVQCGDEFIQHSGSPGSVGTLKPDDSIISEQVLSVGIFELPRQFN